MLAGRFWLGQALCRLGTVTAGAHVLMTMEGLVQACELASSHLVAA